MIHYENIMERFQVPAEGRDILEQILNNEECVLLSGWNGEDTFTEEELAAFLRGNGLAADEEAAERFITAAFCRGVINRAEGGLYCFGSFYGRLDIFATSEAEVYRSLPARKRRELDDWYFDRYLQRLGDTAVKRPTEDEVLPLEETLAFIDRKEEQPYLALCDCRMLTGDCGKPTMTCITYRTADNSFVSRGHAKPITKEEAKQVVRAADKAGLMHTVNPGGVCNCCTDCCYLFRAAEARESQGIWPKSHYTVRLDRERCIGCGACVKRCHFDVFELEREGDGAPAAEVSRRDGCVGCGICVTACPAGALHLEPRQDAEIGGV